MSRSLAGLGLALAALALAAPAHAYVTEASKWNPATLPITYNVNTGTVPTGASVAAVDAGFTTWGGPSCTAWRATNGGSTTRVANVSDGHNTILWLSGSWPAELGDVSSVIGVTTPVWGGFGGAMWFQDADIQFNDVGFTWSATGAGGTVDTQSIATHEEGHFLGLDHTPVAGAIMYASYGGGLVRSLSSDDTNGVCFLYPSGVGPMDAGVPPVDMGSSSDPCAMYTTCDTCTPVGFPDGTGCAWCGATGSCSTQSGPTPPASCGGGYAWYPMDCTTGSTGTGRIGDPCTSAMDCGSGLCVTDGASNFCTHACADDCGCESGYTCYTSGTLSACIPGTNMCATMPPVDMGTTPPMDMGGVIPTDMGTTPHDGSTPPGDGGGGTDSGVDHGRGRGGCCSVPGTSPASTPAGLAALALVALAAGARVRRRRR